MVVVVMVAMIPQFGHATGFVAARLPLSNSLIRLRCPEKPRDVGVMSVEMRHSYITRR